MHRIPFRFKNRTETSATVFDGDSGHEVGTLRNVRGRWQIAKFTGYAYGVMGTEGDIPSTARKWRKRVLDAWRKAKS